MHTPGTILTKQWQAAISDWPSPNPPLYSLFPLDKRHDLCPVEHVRGSNLVEHGLQLLAKSLSINTLRLALEQLRKGRGRGRLGVKWKEGDGEVGVKRREGEGKKAVSDWVKFWMACQCKN